MKENKLVGFAKYVGAAVSNFSVWVWRNHLSKVVSFPIWGLYVLALLGFILAQFL